MRISEIKGSILQYKSTDFIDASEGLVGKTRKNPVELTLSHLVQADDVVNKDGQKESKVLAAKIEGMSLMLRINATKRRMIIQAANSTSPRKIRDLKIRLYQTLDSNRAAKKGDAVQYTTAIAMDIKMINDDKWLRYFDWQQPRGRQHVISQGLIDNQLA